jgi:hypothetical protein
MVRSGLQNEQAQGASRAIHWRGDSAMPDYRHAHVPGGSYFFTVNTYRRQTFLTDAGVRDPTSARGHAPYARSINSSTGSRVPSRLGRKLAVVAHERTQARMDELILLT